MDLSVNLRPERQAAVLEFLSVVVRRDIEAEDGELDRWARRQSGQRERHDGAEIDLAETVEPRLALRHDERDRPVGVSGVGLFELPMGGGHDAPLLSPAALGAGVGLAARPRRAACQNKCEP